MNCLKSGMSHWQQTIRLWVLIRIMDPDPPEFLTGFLPLRDSSNFLRDQLLDGDLRFPRVLLAVH